MKATKIIIACMLVLAFGAVPALGADASASVSGQCYADDDHETGGEGSVGADSDGNTDLVDVEETQSIAEALATFGQGAAEEIAAGNPGGDACDNTDDDDNDGTEEDEDGLGGSAHVAGYSVEACYDNEGLHAPGSC